MEMRQESKGRTTFNKPNNKWTHLVRYRYEMFIYLFIYQLPILISVFLWGLKDWRVEIDVLVIKRQEEESWNLNFRPTPTGPGVLKLQQREKTSEKDKGKKHSNAKVMEKTQNFHQSVYNYNEHWFEHQ